ncbi:MAG: hypothetical protein ACE363_14120 [Alphaproteobacteria bacterium]
MGSPSIAHYGTTIIEAMPPEDAVQKDIPITGELKGALRFLELAGFRTLIENMYPGLGRQYIWNRGSQEDVDYIEMDSFTSYTAVERPATDRPRVGDTFFRLTHADPRGLYEAWQAEDLVTCIGTPEHEAAFKSGDADWILVRGPQKQVFELGPTQATRAENNVIYICTAPDQLDQIAADWCTHFDMENLGTADFYGYANATCLRREKPGITIVLLTPLEGNGIEPRWTEDIFREAGYSHFRMGAWNKKGVLDVTRESFPDGGGDVSFVYFHDSYLELVQVHDDDPALAETVPAAVAAE